METPPSTERTGPQKGDVIDGSYQIDSILAEGTTSTVVSATDRETGTKVAVKIARAGDLESLERFRRAARAMERLKSPFTVRVISVGETQDHVPCMTMEYLEGKTLALTLLQRGALPIDDAVRWIKQTCESVAEAHGKGFLHRDLDAENLFLATPPRGLVGPPSIRVLDYGLSPMWRTNQAEGRLKPGEVPGTSFALPPELVRGADLEARVDIWGLGVCLYRLLTNKYPFSARNLAELCAKLLAERAPDVTKFRPEVTPALAAVVKRCLEREPEDRFPSVRALIVALEEAQDASPNTPQVPTERAFLEDLRETPLSLAVAPETTDDPPTGVVAAPVPPPPSIDDEDPTGMLVPTPQTMRIVPELSPIEHEPADGPSTQPLGRLSPFAELPRPTNPEPPISVELTPSSGELSIAPQLVPISEKFVVPAPKPALPKVSAFMAAQETLPPPGAPPPPPQVSPFMAAQATLPGPGPAMAEPLVFDGSPRTLAMPPIEPTPRAQSSQPAAPLASEVSFAVEEAPRKKRGVLVPLVFVFGIAASIAVGLYVAKATVTKPAADSSFVATPLVSVVATATESFSVTAAPPDSAPPPSEITSTDPVPTAEPASTHRRHGAAHPTATSTTSTTTTTAAPPPSAAHTGSVYDPSAYDPK